MKETTLQIITAIVSLCTLCVTPIVTTWLQNRKENPNMKLLQDIAAKQGKQEKQLDDVKQDVEAVRSENAKNRITLRSIRQHQIAELSEKIVNKCDNKNDSCKADFLHIVDSYKEYHEDGFNSAGTRWFQDALYAMIKYDRQYALSIMSSEYPEYDGVIPDVEMIKS